MTEVTFLVSTVVAAAFLAISPNVVEAQARSSRDTTTAYGARLTAPDATATTNQNRLNNRINNRLTLRIERYRVDSVTNPVAVFQSNLDDRTRTAILATPQAPEEVAGDDPKLRP